MFAEISGSIACLKEAIGLANSIADFKTDYEIKSVTRELNEKLSKLSMDLAQISVLYSSLQCSNIEKDNELRELKMFINNLSKYKPYTTDAGSFVYIQESSTDENIKPHYACPNCHQKAVISILQPIEKDIFVKNYGDYVFQMMCPQCNALFLMDKSKLDEATKEKNAKSFRDAISRGF